MSSSNGPVAAGDKAPQAGHGGTKTSALVVGAIGIVFGDIGTSPLYTLKECLHSEHGVPPSADNLLGLASLIVWSLTLVVTVKYLLFVMRADNHGEGGILALLALLPQKKRESASGGIGFVALLVIAGAALLYGDGMITPAISVLSAIEGLGEAAPSVKPYIVHITCVILFGLFVLQRRGTGGVGRLFGPVMFVWFATIGVMGAWHVAKYPAVLGALDPRYGVRFFAEHGWHGFIVLGSVVLAVTGGEALYADMGHFGARAIRIAWLGLAFPALALAYLGQAALVLTEPSAAQNSFFAMAPGGLLGYALVGLATVATVIASQALISGAFSLTHQAVQLGFFPRVTVKHTSSDTEGQIYVPEINWLLGVACIALVIGFKESSKLAAAFGLAVTGTMAITSVVYFTVCRVTWGWSLAKALPVLVLFLAFDIPFFAANLVKFFEGGFVPVLVGVAFLSVMVVWKRGRRFLAAELTRKARDEKEFLTTLEATGAATIQRSPGTAVFLTSLERGIPFTLVHHARRTHAVPERVVFVTIVPCHAPFTKAGARTKVEDLGKGLSRVSCSCGFMETPDVPKLLAEAQASKELAIDASDITFFVGRETILAGPEGKMRPWEEGLFALLSRNSRSATSYFNLPPEQVVEIGTQVDL